MARPKTKPELLQLADKNYTKLLEYVRQLPNPDTIFPEGTLNRNVRDVLAHLHHWHLMMLKWYEVGMGGNKPEMPAPGYTWKTAPDLNCEIQKMYDDVPLSSIFEKLKTSHRNVFELIKRHTDEELFEKKRYSWTGSTSLGAYLISSTSSHYDWALKLIRRCLR